MEMKTKKTKIKTIIMSELKIGTRDEP